MLCIHTGFAIATGNSWFSIHTSPHRVLFIQCELSKALLRDRVAKYCNSKEVLPDNIYFCTEFDLRIDSTYGLAALDGLIATIQPRVLILDPLYKIFSGHVSDEYDVKKLTNNLDYLIQRYNLAVIITHHTRKSQLVEGRPIPGYGSEEMLGSRILPAWVDSAIWIEKVDGSESSPEDIIKLSFTKARNAIYRLHPINIRIDRDKLAFSLQVK